MLTVPLPALLPTHDQSEKAKYAPQINDRGPASNIPMQHPPIRANLKPPLFSTIKLPHALPTLCLYQMQMIVSGSLLYQV